MPSLFKTVILVLIAAIGAVVFRAVFIAASQPRPARPADMEHVRVAAADLPEGLLLRDTDLAWKDVPRTQVPPGALTKTAGGENDDADLKGDLLRRAVKGGTPLGTADVILPNAPGFLAAALKPGMRAISVAIDDVSGNAGLIQPGDYVDVLLTQQLGDTNRSPSTLARDVESETIVSRVRVLAVGSAFQRPKADAAEPNTRARTVTFEVTPHTAEATAVATHLGSLSLALRSFATSDRNPPATEDETLPQAPPVWAGDVSRALRTMRAMQARATHSPSKGALPPSVIVYRGSKAFGAEEQPRLETRTDTTSPPSGPPNPPSAMTGAPALLAAQPGTHR